MYLLQSFPNMNDIPLEEFIEGSRKELEDITRQFCEEYNSDVGIAFAREWEYFRDHVAPQSDSVEEWNKDHPVHIPFKGTLLRGDALSVSTNKRGDSNPNLVHRPANRARKSIVLDYLNWSRRGERRESSDPASALPNIVVDGPAGIERYSITVLFLALSL